MAESNMTSFKDSKYIATIWKQQCIIKKEYNHMQENKLAIQEHNNNKQMEWHELPRYSLFVYPQT